MPQLNNLVLDDPTSGQSMPTQSTLTLHLTLPSIQHATTALALLLFSLSQLYGNSPPSDSDFVFPYFLYFNPPSHLPGLVATPQHTVQFLFSILFRTV